MQIESCGHPSTSSTAGALGLFQVMPFHFQSDEDPFHPQVNARRGLTYLRRSWELAGGDPRLALAGYNGGHGVIPRGPDQWPAETRRYVYWGTGILEDADRGGHQSPRLAAWLAAGGESLCQQAAVALAGGP
jgi:soluble lytic murein transglycosylase-like protein